MVHTSRTIIRNASFMTVATTLQKIVAFLYFSYVARVLGSEQTGVYFFALSASQLFSIALDIGFSSLIVRETARDRERGWIYLANAFGAKLFLSMISIGIVGGIGLLHGLNLSLPLLLAAFAAVVADSYQILWYAYLRGRQLIGYEAIATVIGQMIVVGLGITVLLLNQSLLLLLVALLIGSLFHALYSYLLLYRFERRWLTPTVHRSILRRMVMESWPFALASIFGKLFSYTDTVVLGFMHSAQLVGFYSVPYKLTFSFQFLPLALIATLYPAMSHLYGKDVQALRNVLSQSMRLILIVGGGIGFGIAATAPALLRFFYGESYNAAIPVAQILPLLIIILFAQYPVGAFLNGSNLQRFQTWAMGGAMVVNVALNLLLIPRFEMMGAVVAAFCSNITLLALGLWKSSRVINFSIGEFSGMLVRVILAGMVMVAVVRFGLENISLAPAIIAGALVYVASVALLRLIRQDDLQKIIKALR